MPKAAKAREAATPRPAARRKIRRGRGVRVNGRGAAEPEPDPSVWRGVFVVNVPRKVLFTKRLRFKTADLPRWEPHIVIDRRTIERNDE